LKIKKISSIVGMLLLIHFVVATTIELEADRDKLEVNETIEFHLEVYPDKPVGGNLAVYREIEPNRFAMVRILYKKPSPGQCYTCVGTGPLTEDLSRNFYFFPKDGGTYYAEANFGNVQKKVNFTVIGVATAYIANRTSASTNLTSTSTNLTSTSTNLTSTNTTTLQVTTSIPKKEKTILDQFLDLLYRLIKGTI